MSNIAAGTSKTTKLCLDDKGNSSSDNNPAITWACNNKDKAQLWTPYSDNTIRINGKCLDVNKNGTADRTLVDLFTCNGGKNQQWKLTPITSGPAKGKQELLGVQSNKCLDIKGASTANGTQLEIFTCNGGINQAWDWVTTGGAVGATNTGLIQSNIAAGTSNTNKLCLDDKGNSTANNNPVITWACNSADKAQQWIGFSDGTITINGFCLDVNKNGTADRTPVDIFACNQGKNQQWTLTPITSGPAKGKTELKSVQSGKCLDIKGASTANGTQLEIFTCNGGNNQAWSWTSAPAGGGGTTGGGGGTTTTKWAYLAPTGLKVTSHTATSVSLSWNAVTGSKPTISGGVPKPSGYTIAIYNASTGKLMKQVTSTTTTVSVTGLTSGSKININVWANGGPLAPPNEALNGYTL